MNFFADNIRIFHDHPLFLNWEAAIVRRGCRHTQTRISVYLKVPMLVVVCQSLLFIKCSLSRSQQTHDVYTTSPQRRCNVMTLHRRSDDVV